MAKEIRWAPQAIEDRKQVLSYWIRRNKSKSFSIKLNKLIKDSIALIKEYPNIGAQTDIEGFVTR